MIAAQCSVNCTIFLNTKTASALCLNAFVEQGGRRTFITNAARKISTVGGSLRDVQMLAGHSSLAVTQRYIDGDSEAMRKIVDLI